MKWATRADYTHAMTGLGWIGLTALFAGLLWVARMLGVAG